MTSIIVVAEPAHIRLLADDLRAADRAEVEAAGMDARKALWRSFRQATLARTAFVDGEIAAMWGVGGCPLGTLGRPWLLTAPPIEHAKVAFVREARYEVREMLTLFTELRGFVDARYQRAIRLLQIMGFNISESFPFGPYGVPFRQYSLRRPWQSA